MVLLHCRISWQCNNTIKGNLIRSDFSTPPCPSGNKKCHACSSGVQGKCTTSGLVYCISCEVCKSKGQEVTYVGETKRPIRLRYNEHLLAAKHSTEDTPLGDHFADVHQGVTLPQQPLSVKILEKQTKDHPNRKIAESLHIQKLKPMLNRNTASWYILPN